MHGSGTNRTPSRRRARGSRLRRSSRSSPSARPAPRQIHAGAPHQSPWNVASWRGTPARSQPPLAMTTSARSRSCASTIPGDSCSGLCLLGQIRHVQHDQRIAPIAAGGRLDRTVGLTDQPAGAYRAARHGCQQRADHAASPRIIGEALGVLPDQGDQLMPPRQRQKRPRPTWRP